jgi:ABC-2 type transport system permease protein
MLSHTAPIFEAQWRAFRNQGSGGGRVASLLLWVVWYGVWALAGAFAQFHISLSDPPSLVLILPWALAGLAFFWQVSPFLTANTGASIALRKLLVYPIPERELFAVELLLRLGTAAESLLVLAGITVGLCRNPAVPGWAPVPALLLFACFNLFLGVGLRSLLERLLAIRRLREAMVMLVILAATLPQVLAMRGVPAEFQRFVLGRQNPLLPWTAAGRLALGDITLAPLAVAAAWTAAAIAFGWAQFRRSLRFDSDAARAVGAPSGAGTGRTALLYRLPGLLLADPLAAIVQNELRSLVRAPRFRVLFLTGFSFGMIIWWPVMGARLPVEPGHISYPVVVCAYALTLIAEVAFWNQFGFDRGAAQIYLSAPVAFSTVLAAKNIAALAFVVFEVTLVDVVCALARVPLRPATVFETYAVTLTLALYFLAAGNLTSVRFPRPIDPEHSWGHASPGRLQIYLLLLFPLFLLPLILAYLACYAFDSRAAFYAVLAFDAFAGAVAYIIATGSAAASAPGRREQFLTALSQSSGPIQAE